MADYSSEKDKTLKKYEDSLRTQAETQKTELDTQLNQQINKAETDVTLQTKELERDYNDIIDANAIQKELDKRQIAETMANLGLSRSGLNATQQTAVELSAGNKNAEAMRQRQAAVDSLTRSLAEYKMEIENTRREKKNEIDANVQNSVAAYDKELTKEVIAAQQKDNEAVLDYNAKMTELQLEQAEESQRLLNKALRLSSWDNNIFEYYDATTNSVKKISADTLAMTIAVQEDMSLDDAKALVGQIKKSTLYNAAVDTREHGTTYEQRANYYATPSFNNTASEFEKMMLVASALPTDDFTSYNYQFGTRVQSTDEAREDLVYRVLRSNLSDDEQAVILSKVRVTPVEMEKANQRIEEEG